VHLGGEADVDQVHLPDTNWCPGRLDHAMQQGTRPTLGG
jgi:hypothetical protein